MKKIDVLNGDVTLSTVTKRYGSGRTAVTALDAVSVLFETATFTAVMGPSGSGKSTLLQCAAGLDIPDKGSVNVGGLDISRYDEAVRARFRRDHIGFIFQSFNLLDALTAEQNVMLPGRLARRRVKRADALAALDAVGLSARVRNRPSELSGGQRQRVAIARALLHRPRVLFADEPTGALDSRSATNVLDLMGSLRDREGQTIVMVTHDPIVAARADRVLFLADGRIVESDDSPDPEAIAMRMARFEEAGPVPV